MVGNVLVKAAFTYGARLSTVTQILLFLPLTLATLSTQPFLLLSLLLFLHSLVHGTLCLLLPNNPSLLATLQVPMHPFLLLTCFNLASANATSGFMAGLNTAASWWGIALAWSSPVFAVMEGLSSLLVVQKMGQIGKDLAGRGENYQFTLLVAAAAAYAGSAWWISSSYLSVATSPLSSTLLGASLTAFLFLTFIGFSLRRTNVIESSGLALFLAYNIWLCGFGQSSVSDFVSSYVPSLLDIVPHMETLINFVMNTLPKSVLIALLYRLSILHFASLILPTIGADSWEQDYGVDSSWDDRPTSKLTHVLLCYRQSLLVTVYSHLLLLDQSSQVWWRWMSIFFTLIMWSIELLISSNDGDEVMGKWKVD